MSAPTFGAFETAIEVAQPLLTTEGIYVSTVTYCRYVTGVTPEFMLPLTCGPSQVVTEKGTPENRNAAARLHLQSGGVFSADTLQVFLDLSQMDPNADLRGWDAATAIRATVASLLINASRYRDVYAEKLGRRIEAHYVAVDIRGSHEYQELARTYELDKDVPRLPRPRLFDK